MGKDLHPSIVAFFEKVVSNHTHVNKLERLANDEHYIYRVSRNFGLSDVVIILNDGYNYGEYDYLIRPDELNDGGVILIAKPEAHFSNETQDNLVNDKILIGKIAVLLGALQKEDYWNYQKPAKPNNT